MRTEETIVHKPDKVQSFLQRDELGNLVEGRTYKYYAPYLHIAEGRKEEDRRRLLKNIKLCFEHEKEMLALSNRKGLPGVTLVREHADYTLEMEYIEGHTLAYHLAQPGMTPLDSRILVTDACRCLYSHHLDGIILNDTNPENFLISPQGRILFCDYGNACSPGELPFRCPPLATGNPKDKSYFSVAQDQAFRADHDMDRQLKDAPYDPTGLKTNRLGPEGDFYVLAKHLLDLCKLHDRALYDPELTEILVKMIKGKYHSGEELLKELVVTTPEIETFDLSEQVGSTKLFENPLSWIPAWRMPRRALATAAGICVVTGLGVAGVQQNFWGTTVDNGKPVVSVLHRPGESAVFASKSAIVEPMKAMSSVSTRTKVQVAENKNLPASALVVPSPKTGVVTGSSKPVVKKSESLEKVVMALKGDTSTVEYRTALGKLAHMESAEAEKTMQAYFVQAQRDAVALDDKRAFRGIQVLQQIRRLHLPIGKEAGFLSMDIERELKSAAPSESRRQRLELLARSHKNHQSAYYTLARWLEDGTGLNGGRDLAAAYRYYVLASSKVSQASDGIKRLEKRAQGIVKNPQDSSELFRLLIAIAERPENSQAQAAIGLIYAEGRYGQSKNKELAAEYLNRSLRNGFAEAREVMKQHGIKG